MAKKITIYMDDDTQEVIERIEMELAIITGGMKYSKSLIIRNALKQYYKKLIQEYGQQYKKGELS